jgi:hypothetical protein
MNPMKDPTRSSNPCRNPGCTRPAEPGDALCLACGLDRFLYERDTRPRTLLASEGRAEGEPRR